MIPGGFDPLAQAPLRGPAWNTRAIAAVAWLAPGGPESDGRAALVSRSRLGQRRAFFAFAACVPFCLVPYLLSVESEVQ